MKKNEPQKHLNESFNSQKEASNGTNGWLQMPRAADYDSIRSALEQGWRLSENQTRVGEYQPTADQTTSLVSVFSSLALVEQRLRNEVKIPEFISVHPWLTSLVRPLGELIFKIGGLMTMPQHWFDRDVYHTMRDMAKAQQVLERRIAQQEKTIKLLQLMLEKKKLEL